MGASYVLYRSTTAGQDGQENAGNDPRLEGLERYTSEKKKETKAGVETLSLDNWVEQHRSFHSWDNARLNFWLRWPHVWEDISGFDMSYFKALRAPGSTLFTSEERHLVKGNDIEEIKRIIFASLHEIDDPIDIYSKHTMLHDAVALNREELFNFLI